MRGDILLYFTDGSLPARLISYFTHGPYVHVAVDMGDGSQIASETWGVVREPISQVKTLYIPVPVQAESPETLADALDFVQGEVGNRYGWIDIVNQALKVRAPRSSSERATSTIAPTSLPATSALPEARSTRRWARLPRSPTWSPPMTSPALPG
jgi:hypothetical protein